MLRRPLPGADGLALSLERLESHPCTRSRFPLPETQLEGDLFDALTIMFVEPGRSERARRAVSCAFGESRFEILTAFLAFVRTAHYWTETHPTLPYEADMLAVMAKHRELTRLLLDRDRSGAGQGGRGAAPYARGIAGDARRSGRESKRRCASLRSGSRRFCVPHAWPFGYGILPPIR